MADRPLSSRPEPSFRVGASVTVDVNGRLRPGIVRRDLGTAWEIECTDGKSPNGYVFPKEAR